MTRSYAPQIFRAIVEFRAEEPTAARIVAQALAGASHGTLVYLTDICDESAPDSGLAVICDYATGEGTAQINCCFRECGKPSVADWTMPHGDEWESVVGVCGEHREQLNALVYRWMRGDEMVIQS